MTDREVTECRRDGGILKSPILSRYEALMTKLSVENVAGFNNLLRIDCGYSILVSRGPDELGKCIWYPCKQIPMFALRHAVRP